MRALTLLEVRFLEQLKETIACPSAKAFGIRSVYLTSSSADSPGLQIGLQLEGSGTLVYYSILIYGTRPVRYHIESSAQPAAETCRGLWNRLLGALNLNLDKSGKRDGRLHLFYEVAYPDKELKRLGEK